MKYLRRERISARAYKLKQKKYGQFKIVKKISDNAYAVDLSVSPKTHHSSFDDD